MKNYVVSWSEDGFWIESNTRVFDSYDTASWFAKMMKNEYNHVRVYESNDGSSY